jgi:hypothetical protein
MQNVTGRETTTAIENRVTHRHFSDEDARAIGEQLGIDWMASPFDLEQFRAGMDVELEHGTHDPDTDVTNDDPVVTGKIALAHLRELPDYYTRLARMESEGEAAGEPASQA